MDLNDLFRQSIPLNEASEFFIGLKKHAEWTDPPDMDGVLEGQFCVPVEQVLAKLKQVIAAKFRLMVAYYTYAQSFRGPWWRAAKIEYHDHAGEEQEGAEFYLKRAVALGGPVHMDEIEPPPATNNPLGISKILMRAEQEMIALQRELRTMVGDENPMKVGIEEHMLHDQHHLDETHQFLTQAEQQMLEAGAQVQGLPEPPPEAVEGKEPQELEPEEAEEEDEPEEEVPIEEKAASMRMSLALSKALDAKKDVDEKVAAMRFSMALRKLAEEGELSDMASPTAGDLQPSNYLAAELLGQQAQQANEAGFYREQLGQAKQESAMMQQQMADVQAQLDQLQQQASESGAQVQQAAQEAMAARDDAVNATMEVAKARIGAQRMRQAILDAASQDPQALGEEALAPQPMLGPDGQPMAPEGGAVPQPGAPDAEQVPGPADEGPAGAAPAGATPPGAAPAAGAEDMNAPAGGPPGLDPSGAQSATDFKTASAALLGALAGGAGGAGGALLAGRNAPALRDRVQQLEGAQDGTFGHAAALAAAKGGLAMGELAEKHPLGAALSGGLTGAMTGLAAGPAIASSGRELGGHLQTVGRAAKRALGG